MRIDAIIPFFAGTSSATHSTEDTRLDYLRQTLDSLAAYDIRATVFVTKRDRALTQIELPVKPIVLDIEAEWLPWATCVRAQERLYDTRPDLIYVTEADQILWVADTDVFSIPNDSRYLAPWRLDLIGPNGECELQGAAEYVTRTGKKYSITNGAHKAALHKGDTHWGLVEQHAQQQAFSGAYFATPEFFSRITFRKRRVLPVEHATGFDAKSTGLCVKTADIERCWVDHLSPRDRFQITPDPQEEVKA